MSRLKQHPQSNKRRTKAQTKQAKVETAIQKVNNTSKCKDSAIVTPVKTRILIALWDLAGVDNQVTKGNLNERIGRKKNNAQDYDKAYKQLEKDDAISIFIKNKREAKISLTQKGFEMLGEGLKNPKFEFNSLIGAKTGNALLKWIREIDKTVSTTIASDDALGKGTITSYKEFKPKILNLFHKLDKSYSYSGLVPIWHLRSEMKEIVIRDDFNSWMMEMQAEAIFYFQSGEALGATEEQKQDSLNSEIRGLLFFASEPTR